MTLLHSLPSIRAARARAIRFRAACGLGIVAVSALSGCSAAPQPKVPEFDASQICATVDTSGALPACRQGFSDAAAVRLPHDVTAEGGFGVFVAGGAQPAVFIDGQGASHQIDDAAVQSLARTVTSHNAAEVYGNVIFYASFDHGAVTALTPVATVDPSVIVTGSLGGKTLEGEISAWDGAESGYGEATLPVQIALDAQTHETPDGPVLGGSITNATVPAQLSDGRSAPALSDAGARNPLQDSFTSQVALQRVPSMHGTFDDELVLAWTDSSSGMGAEFYPTIATAAGLRPLTGEWNVMQHGAPSSGPSLRLTLAG